MIRLRIKSGKILRKPCVSCGNKTSEPHHPDYNKPLEIIWLCHSCHKNLHIWKSVVDIKVVAPAEQAKIINNAKLKWKLK